MTQDEAARITGRVFDIQHFSTHDGPGVRTTVFLKGCPLSCRWCSNPESQSPRPQILYHRQLCRGCGACLKACDKKAIAVVDGELRYDRSRCWSCGACAQACPCEARTLSGRLMSVDEVCREVRQDWRTYMHSGGGVTFGRRRGPHAARVSLGPARPAARRAGVSHLPGHLRLRPVAGARRPARPAGLHPAGREACRSRAPRGHDRRGQRPHPGQRPSARGAGLSRAWCACRSSPVSTTIRHPWKVWGPSWSRPGWARWS